MRTTVRISEHGNRDYYTLLKFALIHSVVKFTYVRPVNATVEYEFNWETVKYEFNSLPVNIFPGTIATALTILRVSMNNMTLSAVICRAFFFRSISLT